MSETQNQHPENNSGYIELLKRQINAAKDYLRRLHPRFEEERKQREEWIQQKEAELKRLENQDPEIEQLIAELVSSDDGDKSIFEGCESELRELFTNLEKARTKLEEKMAESTNPKVIETLREMKKKQSEKENGANSPQLDPCPFCGRFPLYSESAHSIFCHNDDCKERPQVYCRNEEALVSMWNHLGDGLEADYKECQRTSCEGCEILGECENENQMDCDPWKYDCQIPLDPCNQCGAEPESEIEGDLSLGCVECPNCGKRVQTEENVTPEKLADMWNEKNPLNSESDQNNTNKRPEARRDDPISFFDVNPCAKCGYDPQTVESSEMVTIYCPKCTRVSQFKERNKAIEFWNQQNPLKAESSESDSDNPFKPCSKCGNPVEWEMSLSGRRGWVKCPRCGNEMTVDDEEYHTMEEWVEMWNQVNTKPENQIPPKFSQVMKEIEQRIPVNMLNKLYLLNSILGLQRDEKGPAIEVKKIQETILEIDRTLQKGEIWKNDEAISELTKQIEKMKSDEYLAPSENRKIAVHGSVYVTALHIAGAVCRESERYAWEYEQKHGIEELSQVCKYLDQLAEWLFVRAEYLRETEECC